MRRMKIVDDFKHVTTEQDAKYMRGCRRKDDLHSYQGYANSVKYRRSNNVFQRFSRKQMWDI